MKKTDFLLIIPHQPDSAGLLREPAGITQPLGAGYIAAYLESRGLSAAILDNSIELLDGAAFRDRVAGLSPLAVGFTVCSSSHNTALRLAGLVKETDPSITVVMGGVHPSALPDKMLENKNVDIVVRGEGEETSYELITALKSGTGLSGVNGIVYREGTRRMETPPRKLIEDLDSLPFPAHHLMPMDKYGLPASRRLTNKPAASLATSRGCPYKCRFCSHNSVFGGKVRLRSPQNVMAEIKRLAEQHGVGELLFWDDSFLLDKNRAVEICRLIRESGLDLTWSCSSRADHITPELAATLRGAGCRMILFGVESGSEKILSSVNKGTRPGQIRNAVKACRDAGILSFCSFIIGTPDETEETIRETKEFVKALDPDFSIFCIFAPLPGSFFFDEFLKAGRLDLNAIDWDQYINLLSNRPPLMAAGALSEARLVAIQKELFQAFYFRPSYIWRRLKLLRTPQHLYQNLRGLKTLLKLRSHKF